MVSWESDNDSVREVYSVDRVKLDTSSLLKILPQMSSSPDLLLSIVVSALIEAPFALPTRLSKSTLLV